MAMRGSARRVFGPLRPKTETEAQVTRERTRPSIEDGHFGNSGQNAMTTENVSSEGRTPLEDLMKIWRERANGCRHIPFQGGIAIMLDTCAKELAAALAACRETPQEEPHCFLVSMEEEIRMQSPEAPPEITQFWAVSVERNGENIVTIESHCLSGRDISPEDARVIEMAADHLLSFLDKAPSPEPSVSPQKDVVDHRYACGCYWYCGNLVACRAHSPFTATPPTTRER